MRFGDHGPAVPSTRTRYCRATRRHGAVPQAPYLVRHGPTGIRLTRIAPPPPTPRLWRGKLGFAGAVAVLALCATMLQTGAYRRPATIQEPCPEQASTAAYASGHKLLVRVEPALGPSALVHLCADRGTGPVRAWSLRTGDGATSAAQGVARGTALAVAPLSPGRRTSIEVVVVPQTGPPLTFTTEVTAR